MLQVWDELDDVVSSARLLWVGVRRAVMLALAMLSGALGMYAIQMIGAGAFVYSCAAVLASAVLALSLHHHSLD